MPTGLFPADPDTETEIMSEKCYHLAERDTETPRCSKMRVLSERNQKDGHQD